MKHFFTLNLLLLGALLTGCSSSDEDQEPTPEIIELELPTPEEVPPELLTLSVTNSDLQECIDETIKLKTITTIEDFDELVCYGPGVPVLNGIEQLTNLTSLHLGYGYFYDNWDLFYQPDYKYHFTSQTNYLGADLTPLNSLAQLRHLSLDFLYTTPTVRILGLDAINSLEQLRSLSLAGLENVNSFNFDNLTNLEQLRFSVSTNNPISLTRLDKLEYLDLGWGINEIPPLHPEVNLKHLNVSGLSENDIANVANHQNLESLSFTASYSISTNYYHHFANLPLKRFKTTRPVDGFVDFINSKPNLENLNVRFSTNGPVSTINLANFQLDKLVVNAYENSVSVTLPTNTQKLTELNLVGVDLESNSYNFSDFSNLEYFTYLDVTDGSSIQLPDSIELKSLLTDAVITNSEIPDYEALIYLNISLADSSLTVGDFVNKSPALETITIDVSGSLNANELDPIFEANKVTAIELENVQTDNPSLVYDGLQNLALTHLSLINTDFTDLSLLENMTSLLYLEITTDPNGIWGYTPSDNPHSVSDISALAGLTNLYHLNLNNQNISDISAIENLTKLYALHLIDNPIEDYSPLAELENVRDLVLMYNGIRSLDELPNELLTRDNEIPLIFHLQYNDITSIYPTMGNMSDNAVLALHGNKVAECERGGQTTEDVFRSFYTRFSVNAIQSYCPE